MDRLTHSIVAGLAVIIAAGLVAAIIAGLLPGMTVTRESVRLDPLPGYRVVARAVHLTIKPGEPQLVLQSKWCSARYSISPAEGLVEIEAGNELLPICKAYATLTLPSTLDNLGLTLQAVAATITGLNVRLMEVEAQASTVTVTNSTLYNASLNLEASTAAVDARLPKGAHLAIHAKASSVTILVRGEADIRVEGSIASSIVITRDTCRGGGALITLDLLASHAVVKCVEPQVTRG